MVFKHLATMSCIISGMQSLALGAMGGLVSAPRVSLRATSGILDHNVTPLA